MLPPERSQHVRGLAVDVKPVGGAAWLEREGYRWGLCRRYANESWHFELLTTPGTPCPPTATDAAGEPTAVRARDRLVPAGTFRRHERLIDQRRPEGASCGCGR